MCVCNHGNNCSHHDNHNGNYGDQHYDEINVYGSYKTNVHMLKMQLAKQLMALSSVWKANNRWYPIIVLKYCKCHGNRLKNYNFCFQLVECLQTLF